jgi:HSP20 family molecular chaperone IbpA
VTATYKDGILEVRAPLPPEPQKDTSRRVTVDRQ